MRYRVCKSFEVESGHMLMKHGGLCRYPHGHTRRIDVVLAGPALDPSDMLCDFKAIKLAVRGFIEKFDHSMAMNSLDPMLERLGPMRERVVVFEGVDPTAEVMARHIFEFIAGEIRSGRTYPGEDGVAYRFPAGVELERVRVTETPTSWAEYGIS